MADGGRGNAQLLGRPCKAQLPRGTLERAQRRERREPTHALIDEYNSSSLSNIHPLSPGHVPATLGRIPR
jgi:hypothetical protein